MLPERLIYQAQPCEYCGRWCEAGEGFKEWTTHHLYQRSVRPDMIEDPNNLMVLCGKCHQFATDHRWFEQELIRMFYGRTRAAARAKGETT